MSITKKLQNITKFESVGFTHEQAKVIERSYMQSQENLKEFIRNELIKKTKVFNSNLSALETRHITSQKDFLIKLFGIIVGTIGIAVTVLKLFYVISISDNFICKSFVFHLA